MKYSGLLLFGLGAVGGMFFLFVYEPNPSICLTDNEGNYITSQGNPSSFEKCQQDARTFLGIIIIIASIPSGFYALYHEHQQRNKRVGK